MKNLICWLLALFCCPVHLTKAGGETATAKIASRQDVVKTNVFVLLWFDTEDYLLPAADDAAKRLAEILTQRGVRGTFKVVGEKARQLERRGRRDVIDALRKHDIGYHTDFHSVHPTPAEYLAGCGWTEGVAEFLRRESQGAADVRRIFSVPHLACYGQPGSSWAPQVFAALETLAINPRGVPCYVDEGDHLGLGGRPFWFDGVLTVYKMGENCTRMELHEAGALETARRQATALIGRLQGQGGGLVSIYYHPCEWVHQQFWDGVNFSRGANPPREQWRNPPQRPAGETEAALVRFAAYIDFLRTCPGVRFITASELPDLYPDYAKMDGIAGDILPAIARQVVQSTNAGINCLILGGKAFSPADQFELLSRAVWESAAINKPIKPIWLGGLTGPVSPPFPDALPRCDWPAFQAALADVEDFISKQRQVPARVWLGANAVSPASFLYGLAGCYLRHQETGRWPVQEGVSLKPGLELLTARLVAQDAPGLYGGWIIHPAGFRAPQLLELARLQAWTFKPALLQASAPTLPNQPNRKASWARPIHRPGLKNLHRVNSSLYRGAQPEEPGFKELQAMGIRTIINLRGFHSDEPMLAGLPLRQEHISFKTWHPEDEDVVRFLKIVGNPKRGPFFVHCLHGSDRTGMMLAIYRVAIQGWSKEEAIAEMTTGGFGFHSIWQNLVNYLKALDLDRLKKEAGI